MHSFEGALAKAGASRIRGRGRGRRLWLWEPGWRAGPEEGRQTAGDVEGTAGNLTPQPPALGGGGQGAGASHGTLTVQEMQDWEAGVRARPAFYP